MIRQFGFRCCWFRLPYSGGRFGIRGSEPGGGGYTAQRMLAAKNEDHAVAATAFFNFAHYVIRPWPWIIVALASLVIFPDLDSLRIALPHVDPSIIGHDLAYPAMLSLLPTGVLGFGRRIAGICLHLHSFITFELGGIVRRQRRLCALPTS